MQRTMGCLSTLLLMAGLGLLGYLYIYVDVQQPDGSKGSVSVLVATEPLITDTPHFTLTPSVTPTPVHTPTPAYRPPSVEVRVTRLPIYNLPQKGSRELRYVTQGEIVVVAAKSLNFAGDPWYFLRQRADGNEEWIRGSLSMVRSYNVDNLDHRIPTTATPETPLAATVLSSGFNVYAGPDPNYEVIGQLDRSDRLSVQARTADNSWLEVCCIDKEVGWAVHNPADIRVHGYVNILPIKAGP